jgi:hypothetical protein
MAKRNVTWTVSKGVLTATHVQLGNVTTSYDLHELFPDYDDFDNAQKGTIKNGVKQRLVDKTTDAQKVKLTPQERLDWMNDTWILMTVERVYKRTAEEKMTMTKKIKAAKEVATPEQLQMMKDLGLI